MGEDNQSEHENIPVEKPEEHVLKNDKRSISFRDVVGPTLSSRAMTLSRAQSLASTTMATSWRNKTISCDVVRSFEARRKVEIDSHHEKDRKYWQQFEALIHASREEAQRLQKFFTAKLQADAQYAESLLKLETVLERSITSTVPKLTTSTERATDALGEVHSTLGEKIAQFVTAVKRDVVKKLVDELVKLVEETSQKMLTEGNKLNRCLYATQDRVLDAFATFDALYRSMEMGRGATNTDEQGATAAPKGTSNLNDLWLLELKYYVSVRALRDVRQLYVGGMFNLLQQFKALETNRNATEKTVMEAYLRKQKLLFSELAGSLGDSLSLAQRIDPERDVAVVVKKIPLNVSICFGHAACKSLLGSEHRALRIVANQ